MKFRKREVDVIENFNVRVKEYVNGRVEMTLYDRDIKKIKEGYELSDKEQDIRTSKMTMEKSDKKLRKDNVHRSYKTLVDYALQNSDKFKSFITLTFKNNVTDIAEANKMFNNWTKQVRRIQDDFMYLGVPEFQKRGAIHYHIMTNLEINGSKIISEQEGKKSMYDVKYWQHGFTSVFDLELTDDKFSVSAYLTKYFYKDIDDRLFGHNKILKSNNLSKPTEKTMNTNSKDYINYIQYLTKSKQLQMKKSIQTESKYAPNMTIMIFN